MILLENQQEFLIQVMFSGIIPYLNCILYFNVTKKQLNSINFCTRLNLRS